MTWVKDAVEIYVNLNLTLLFALLLWLCLRALMSFTTLRNSYRSQLSILKGLLVLVALSPVLSAVATRVQEVVLPGQSLVLSDMVVAAYLRGDIAIDAIQFEQLLNTRSSWTDGLLALSSPVFSVLITVLALGLAAFVVRFCTAVWRVQHMIHGSHLLKRIGCVDVRVSDRVNVPLAARGLLRRHIVLPYDLVGEGRDCRMALAHELQHFRSRDLEWEITLEMLRPLFFWNPCFFVLKRHFDRLRELSCDEAVLERRRFDPLDYALCLLRFCERAVQVRRRSALNVALISTGRISARRDLAQRLLSLKNKSSKMRFGSGHVVGFILVFGMAFALFSASIQTHKDWSHDRLMLSTVVNLERLEAINRGF